MNMDIHSQAEELNKKHRRKRTWYKILSENECGFSRHRHRLYQGW